MHTTTQLDKRAEFEALLKHYQMSSAAQQLLDQTPFVTMLALTATGRNTIIRELIKTGFYYFIVSDTTRPPRYNDGVLEQNGVEYFFRTEQEMLEEIQQGQFVEAELIHNQQVSGVSIREVQKAYEQRKIAITDVDKLGAVNLARLKPDVISIMLLPPSFDEWMRRIRKRTHVTADELQRRAETAPKILELTLQEDFFIFVINNNLQQAVATVDSVVRRRQNPEGQQEARELAKKLLQDIRSFLNN